MATRSFALARSTFITLLLVIVIWLAASCTALGQSEWIVYSFGAVPGGIFPAGNLIADSAGNLYGTTPEGGTQEWGTVYELVKPVPPQTAWTQIVLHNFTNGVDGGQPSAGLVFDEAGNLYGATIRGTSSRHGVVFELSHPATAGGKWKETVLHVFEPLSGDAENPVGALVWDGAGNLYGATADGGADHAGVCVNPPNVGCGSIFELSPPATPGGAWTETVVHSFNYGQGGFPAGCPVLDAHGDLYGTTYAGGRYGDGVIYRLSPPTIAGGAWTYRVLHSFTGLEGVNPRSSLVVHGKAVLYGTTSGGGAFGGGTVFQFVPPTVVGGAWTENVLYNFGGFAGDALSPADRVIFDSAGNIYGTTPTGGAMATSCSIPGCGAVFQLTPPATEGGIWTETILHSFPSNESDGARPSSGLLFGTNGILFGVTQSTGDNGEGAVYGIVR